MYSEVSFRPCEHPHLPLRPSEQTPGFTQMRRSVVIDRASEILELLVVLVAHVRCIHALAFRCIVILVEAASVSGMFDLWDNGAFRSPLIHRIPVYGLEIDVILDASSSVGKVPQTLSGIDSAETRDQLASVGCHSMGISDLATADSLYPMLA